MISSVQIYCHLWLHFFPSGSYPVSLMAQLVKNPPAMQKTWVQFLGWEDPLEKEKLPTPVFWPGEFHGLYSPWGCKESDMTEQLSFTSLSRNSALSRSKFLRRLILLNCERHWNTFFNQTHNTETHFLLQSLAKTHLPFEIINSTRFLYPLSFFPLILILQCFSVLAQLMFGPQQFVCVCVWRMCCAS